MDVVQLLFLSLAEPLDATGRTLRFCRTPVEKHCSLTHDRVHILNPTILCKVQCSACLFFSDTKSLGIEESMKEFSKSEPKTVLEDSDSLSMDPDLSVSAFAKSEVTDKKGDDEWNWNDGSSDDAQLDPDKSTSTVVADDVLGNLSGDEKMDDDLVKMEKEDGCMLIEMTGNEEDPKFIIVSPQSVAAAALDTVKLEGLESIAHKCKSCNRQFARRQSLLRHERQHICGSGTGKHACSLCGQAFQRRTELDDHMASKHVNQPTSSLVKCATCHKECSSLTEFNAHLAESPDCASGDQQIFVTGEINYRPFLCDICGKNFSTALSLRMHHKLHTGERPFACGTCGKSFVQKIQLTQHELRHLGIRPFACTMCVRTFSQKGQLTAHMRLHTGDRPFVCECGADFLSKAMLSQHRRTHSGDRPHVCATCGKAFAYKESLVVHIRTHTGEKPFECAICGSRYTQSHHLKGHLRTHTGEKPFACQLCEKTYKNRVDLRFHCTRVHSVDITKRHAKSQIITLNG